MIMGEDTKTRFRVLLTKRSPEDRMWSFGMCLSHWAEETYLYINFFRWSISIGKLYDD